MSEVVKTKSLAVLLVVAALAIGTIFVIAGNQTRMNRGEDADNIDNIRQRCKPTIMYVIDNFDQVRKVYDCTEKPK